MKELNLKYDFSVAPMMGVTTSSARYMYRLISSEAILFTEMIASQALHRGDHEKLLKKQSLESPLVLQIGGSDIELLKYSTNLANQFNFQGINLNVGCPSKKVSQGKMGVCLMKEANLVKKCISSMIKESSVDVSLKCRIGVDEFESYSFFKEFMSTIAESDCSLVFVHARKAYLTGLDPKKNRTIPPLKYEFVHQIKKDFPNLEIILNGGVNNIPSIKKHLKYVDGVMIGREIYKNPYFLKQIEEEIFKNKNVITRKKVLEKLIPYIESEIKKNKANIQSITRHTFGLFTGIKGSKRWKQYLNKISIMKGNVKDIV